MGRILIADDHDALRRGLVRGLTEGGHEVEEASNGNAAIERLTDSYFDVVLSDLKMGGSDGMDVLRTTRALHPTTAVILMTAFGTVAILAGFGSALARLVIGRAQINPKVKVTRVSENRILLFISIPPGLVLARCLIQWLRLSAPLRATARRHYSSDALGRRQARRSAPPSRR